MKGFYNVEWALKDDDDDNWQILFRCSTEDQAKEYARQYLSRRGKGHLKLRIIHYTGVCIFTTNR